MATTDTASAPSASSAASILATRDLPPSTREQARNKLKRAFSANPEQATLAAAKLASDGNAPPEDRALALDLMRELAPKESYEAITEDVKEALDSATEVVKAAALPLYARIAPKPAAGVLASLFDKRDSTSDNLRVAMALGWGQVAARTKERAAAAALEILLVDRVAEVRAAAAEAYGNVGRSAQSQLAKMVKNERFDVAVGAAYGLANSAAVGASTSVAVFGITQMWKRKGRPRRGCHPGFCPCSLATSPPRRIRIFWPRREAARIPGCTPLA